MLVRNASNAADTNKTRTTHIHICCVYTFGSECWWILFVSPKWWYLAWHLSCARSNSSISTTVIQARTRIYTIFATVTFRTYNFGMFVSLPDGSTDNIYVYTASAIWRESTVSIQFCFYFASKNRKSRMYSVSIGVFNSWRLQDILYNHR